jgi:hypothetical protein
MPARAASSPRAGRRRGEQSQGRGASLPSLLAGLLPSGNRKPLFLKAKPVSLSLGTPLWQKLQLRPVCLAKRGVASAFGAGNINAKLMGAATKAPPSAMDLNPRSIMFGRAVGKHNSSPEPTPAFSLAPAPAQSATRPLGHPDGSTRQRVRQDLFDNQGLRASGRPAAARIKANGGAREFPVSAWKPSQRRSSCASKLHPQAGRRPKTLRRRRRM